MRWFSVSTNVIRNRLERTNALVTSKSNHSIPSIPDKCNKEVHSIHNSDDLKHLEECETIEGDVAIVNYKEPIVEFSSKLQKITGSFTVRNAPNLVRIEAPRLASIGNSFSLRELTSLALLSFPSMKLVKILDWQILPILSTVHLGNEIKDVKAITVSDTSLTSFSGFLSPSLDVFDINNNRFLESINSNVEKVTGKLHIAANADNAAVDLSALKSANNITIQEIAKLELGNLESVENSVSLINNNFKSLKVPKLKTVGGTLSLVRNPLLSAVEFPATDEIGGGLVIVNNSAIDKINFLPRLSIIGGAMELAGGLKEILLKLLKLVKGSARINAMTTTFDCTKWSKSEVGSIIRGGRIECSNIDGKIVDTKTSTGDSTTGSEFEQGSGLYNDGILDENLKEESRASAIEVYWPWVLGALAVAGCVH